MGRLKGIPINKVVYQSSRNRPPRHGRVESQTITIAHRAISVAIALPDMGGLKDSLRKVLEQIIVSYLP